MPEPALPDAGTKILKVSIRPAEAAGESVVTYSIAKYTDGVPMLREFSETGELATDSIAIHNNLMTAINAL